MAGRASRGATTPSPAGTADILATDQLQRVPGSHERADCDGTSRLIPSSARPLAAFEPDRSPAAMRLVLLTLAAFASAAAAQTGARPTAVYADVLGPTSAYAVGLEHAVWTSADADRQLRVRAGASYWSERAFGLEFQDDRVVAVPAGGLALFSLGRPLGLPAAFEFGAGAVAVRRSGPRYADVGERFALRPYGETAVRAALGGRVVVRAGATVGGEASDLLGSSLTDDGVRPVVGIGVGL